MKDTTEHHRTDWVGVDVFERHIFRCPHCGREVAIDPRGGAPIVLVAGNRQVFHGGSSPAFSEDGDVEPPDITIGFELRKATR